MAEREIHEIHYSDALFERSNEFAQGLYPEGSSYHSDLSIAFFIKAWVVIENDSVLARVVAYENPAIPQEIGENATKKVLLLGNYECINALDVSQELFKAVWKFATTKGYGKVIGPMSGSTWDNYRFKITGNRPFLGEAINREYYAQQWISAGFSVAASYHSFMDRDVLFEASALLMREKELMEKGVCFKPIDVNDYENALRKIYEFNALAFSQNEFFTPIALEDFVTKYQKIKSLIDPFWVEMVEAPDGQLVGYLLAYEDKFDPQNQTVVLKTVARLSGRDYRGLGLVLARRLNEKAIQRNKKQVIHAYMHQKNPSLHCSETMNGNAFATYQLFELSLHTNPLK